VNNQPIVEYSVSMLAAGVVMCVTKPFIRWWRRRPWKMRGLPLRGANVIVESITPLPSQLATNAPERDNQLWYYFAVNVTIQPVGRYNKIPWMPADLKIVPAERWRPEQPESGELGRYCRIESLELVCGDVSFEPDNAFCVYGRFNVQLRLSARHDIRVVQFRYYLEQFGALELPAPISENRASSDLLNVPEPIGSE
jgi:hypothetical protein